MSKQQQRAAAVAVRVWLARHEKNQRWLADRIRVSEGLLSNILKGRREPSDEVRDAIQQVTGIDLRDYAGEVV